MGHAELLALSRDLIGDAGRLAEDREVFDDPNYAAAFIRARAAGVEAMAWACAISTGEISLDRPVRIEQ
jgi:sugar fermentation stimulation protein A